MIMDVINYRRRSVMNIRGAGEYFCVSRESAVPMSQRTQRVSCTNAALVFNDPAQGSSFRFRESNRAFDSWANVTSPKESSVPPFIY